MIKTFTSNDIVRYFYGEVSEVEKREIEKALNSDSKLQECYNDLKKGTEALKDLETSPRKKVVDNILLYSKTLSLPN